MTIRASGASALSVLTLLAITTVGIAQTGSGSLQGTVKDATGGVIPGAEVTAVHSQTSRQHDTITNEVGFFLFPSLQTGTYRITAKVPGLQSWQGDILLQVGQTAVVDPVLRLVAST